jgi:hypothetical protein
MIACIAVSTVCPGIPTFVSTAGFLGVPAGFRTFKASDRSKAMKISLVVNA